MRCPPRGAKSAPEERNVCENKERAADIYFVLNFVRFLSVRDVSAIFISRGAPLRLESLSLQILKWRQLKNSGDYITYAYLVSHLDLKP